MSGIEAMGLVLAILPLVISAVEQYNDGLDPIKAFMGWEKELPQYIRKLRNQHVHYEQTLRQLLSPITTEEELAELLTDPQGELWKESDITERLQSKLAEAYFAYQGTMGDIERIMKKIASKLDLDGANSTDRNALEAVLVNNPCRGATRYQFKRRVKFSMSKKRIKSMLEQLDDCNRELERFTDKSEKIEPYRQQHAKNNLVAPLQKIQSYAKNLHGILSSAWNCSCHADHETNLRLEERVTQAKPKSPYKRKQPFETMPLFKVSFSSTKASSWSWQEAEIYVIEAGGAMLTPQTSNVGEQYIDPLPSLKSSKVKFLDTEDDAPPSYDDATRSTSSRATSLEITDICQYIRHSDSKNSCIKFSLQEGRLQNHFASRLPPTPPPIDQRLCGNRPRLLSLKDLLTSPPVTNGVPTLLSRKDRYILSVTLASSILQLHGSPWLRNHWTKDDILFFADSSGGNSVDLTHPYVKSGPPSPLHSSSSLSGRPSLAPTPTIDILGWNRNTSLLALGLTLLELYFNSPAESIFPAELFSGGVPPASATAASGQPSSPHAAAPTPLTTLATAQRWIDARRGDLSSAVLSAVAHCLRCFADPSASLADEVFLQQAVECIVLPLQEELGTFVGVAGI